MSKNCGNCKYGVRIIDSIRDGYSCDNVVLMYDECIRLDYQEWKEIDQFIMEEEMTL